MTTFCVDRPSLNFFIPLPFHHSPPRPLALLQMHFLYSSAIVSPTFFCFCPNCNLLRTPGIDFTESFPCEKSIPSWNTQTIWQLSEGLGDEKSIPAGKIYIVWDMADLIPYLVPTQFQESILLHFLSKNTGTGFSVGFELIHIACPLFGSRKKVAESILQRIRTAVAHPDLEVRI
jgi:hypothetical protein